MRFLFQDEFTLVLSLFRVLRVFRGLLPVAAPSRLVSAALLFVQYRFNPEISSPVGTCISAPLQFLTVNREP